MSERGIIDIGFDDGHNNLKIVGVDKSLRLNSTARSGHSNIASIGGNSNVDIREYESNGRVFAAGDVEGEATQLDAYPYSDINRVLIHHGLHKFGLSGEKVRIVTGLPVSHFYRNLKINTDLVNKKIDNLSMPVIPADGTDPVEIVTHDVVSEGIAAWVDYIMTMDGQPVDGVNMSDPVGIVDIGGRTTDIAIIYDQSVDLQRSGSIKSGMLDIRESLKDSIIEKYDLDDLSTQMAEKAVATGSVRLFGKEHDISHLLADAVREVTGKIHHEVQRRIGKGAELEKVVFVGGGTMALRKGLAGWFRNQVIPDAPEMANARGMLKYLRFIK